MFLAHELAVANAISPQPSLSDREEAAMLEKQELLEAMDFFEAWEMLNSELIFEESLWSEEDHDHQTTE
jgi:hypothetical protein